MKKIIIILLTYISVLNIYSSTAYSTESNDDYVKIENLTSMRATVVGNNAWLFHSADTNSGIEIITAGREVIIGNINNIQNGRVSVRIVNGPSGWMNMNSLFISW